MADALPPVPDEFLLTELDQFEMLSSPIRMRILRQATEPVTVREIAEAFDVPITRLYYHVNLLVGCGMLVQVGQRKSGARLEKVYRTAAKTFRPAKAVLETTEDPRKLAEIAVSVVFDPARAEAAAAIERDFLGRAGMSKLGRSHVKLTREQAGKLAERIEELISDLGSDEYGPATDGEYWSVTLSFMPTE